MPKAELHVLSFYRSRTEPGLYRGVCSCGWSMESTEEDVRRRAATHDLEEIKEPPLRIEGFVSGLPD